MVKSGQYVQGKQKHQRPYSTLVQAVEDGIEGGVLWPADGGKQQPEKLQRVVGERCRQKAGQRCEHQQEIEPTVNHGR